MNDHILDNRRFVLGGIAVAIVLIYIARLAFLQLMDNDYKASADNNAFMNKVIYPSRGSIYDRNGALLV